MKLQSITLDKAHFPTQDHALAFIANQAVVPDELIEYEEAWRVEFSELQSGAKAQRLAEGAIAVYLQEAEVEDPIIASSGFPNPTPDQLKKIQAIAPKNITYVPEELVVVEVVASDNLIWLSNGTWSLNALEQMAKSYPQRPFMLDHDWRQTIKTKGVVFDAYIEDVAPTSEIINYAGQGKNNRKIIKKDGYKQLITQIAFEATSPFLNDIKFRRVSDVSTGSLTDGTYLCPHCTDEEGNNLNFDDPDCPHDIPDPWLLFWIWDANPAEYYIMDGWVRSVELSAVVKGDLPAAHIA